MSQPLIQSRPKMREGVSASCVSLPAGPWTSLLEFLSEKMPNVEREIWQMRMQAQQVFDEYGQTFTPEAVYRPHTRVYYYRELETEDRIPVEETVLFQDEHLVVADKPHFLPVMPAGRFVQETLLVRLKRRLALEHLAPVHRIDRETAGLVLFCVKPEERGAYHALFSQRRVLKRYQAIAPWQSEIELPKVYRSRIVSDLQFFRQREEPGEPNSETLIELQDTQGALARYQLEPVTGKTHQLRVHMNALGRPIVGDLIYPRVVHGPGEPGLDLSQPLQLLARSLSFTDPITGEARHFETQQRLNWPPDQA